MAIPFVAVAANPRDDAGLVGRPARREAPVAAAGALEVMEAPEQLYQAAEVMEDEIKDMGAAV